MPASHTIFLLFKLNLLPINFRSFFYLGSKPSLLGNYNLKLSL